MVEFLVEVRELFEGQVRYFDGIATAVDSVGVVGENGLLRLPLQKRVGRRIHPLHFVVDDSFVGERFGDVFQFKVPALLGMDHGIRDGAGMKHRVAVDVDEVVKILGVLAGHDVARAIGVGERVEERL